MQKRVLSLLVVITLLLSVFTPAFAEGSDQINRGEVANMLLEAADDYNPGIQKTDIIKGYEDGELHEERLVTRAEALVMLKRAFGELPTPKGHNERIALKAENFTDIPSWAENELNPVFDTGIVAGTADGIFSPDNNVTYEQMELFIKRIFSLYGTNLKDDFYATVNKDALDSITELDPKYLESSPVIDTAVETNERVNGIIKEIVSSNPQKGTIEYQIAALYNSALNFYTGDATEEGQSVKDIEPIRDYLNMIDSAKSITELTAINNKISEEIAFSPIFEINKSIMINGKDNSKYMPVLSVPTCNASTTIAYEAMKIYIKDMFIAAGESQENADKTIDMYNKLSLKTDICSQQNSDALESLRETSFNDYINTVIDADQYKGYSYDSIKELFAKDSGIDSVFEIIKADSTDIIFIEDIAALKAFADYYNNENLSNLKAYAKYALINAYGPLLSGEFVKLNYNFMHNILGVEIPASYEDAAMDIVKEYFSDYIGLKYTEKYFLPETKSEIEKIVSDIKAVYETMLRDNEWLSEETREKAIEKLKAIKAKIGGCDEYDDTFIRAEILSPDEGGTYFKNIIAIEKVVNEELVKYLDEPVDKNMWIAPSYEINAFYNPFFNEIIIPAGFLQAPFYDANASYEQNLGGLGFVIAHEITHAFDSTGSWYDKDGNLALWWTLEDYANFERKSESMKLFYDAKESLPGISVNGELTLGENISDNGAMSCITLAASLKSKNPDYKAIYESFAKCWIHSTVREIYNIYALIDTHSPGKLRVNRCLSNCDKFYEVYGITEKDGMYVAPEERVKIW